MLRYSYTVVHHGYKGSYTHTLRSQRTLRSTGLVQLPVREYSTMPGKESYLRKNHRSSMVSGFGCRLPQIQNSFTIPLPSQFAGFRERPKGQKGKFEQKHICPLQGLLAGNSRSHERCAEPENPAMNHSPHGRMGEQTSQQLSLAGKKPISKDCACK